jgi:dTDP-4-amino-4,6-dideoxygalactose transaminase
MDAVVALARRHGIVVIEDACQAHGAAYKGRRVGGLGEMACFSFYPGKSLGAYGEGGCVLTNHPEFERTVRLLRNWGEESRYHHVMRGYNYRMEGMQGAILRVKLRHLESWIDARRERAAAYERRLGVCVKHRASEEPWARHSYSVYAIESEARDRLQQALAARQIQTAIHYPEPIHLMQPYRDPEFPAGSFPEAERVAKRILSLPIYPELPLESVGQVAAAIRESLPE